jgi:hypothetical protein
MAGAPSVSRDDLPVTKQLFPCQTSHFFPTLLLLSGNWKRPTQFAKFGWTHCLTLPQAACGLSAFNIDRKLALAAALVWTTAYRSVLSDRDLVLKWAPEKLKGSASLKEALQTSPAAAAARAWHADPQELPLVKQALATQASIRTDQHLVKYTRACLDMVSFDPKAKRLYLAAAAHLCAVWLKEQPEATIKERLFQDRKK